MCACFPHEGLSALIGKLGACDGQRNRHRFINFYRLFAYLSFFLVLLSPCNLEPRTYALLSGCVREAEGVGAIDYSLQQQVKGLTCVRGTLLQGVGVLQ